MALKMVAIRARKQGQKLIIEKLVETPRGTRVIDGTVELDDEKEDKELFLSRLEAVVKEFYPKPE